MNALSFLEYNVVGVPSLLAVGSLFRLASFLNLRLHVQGPYFPGMVVCVSVANAVSLSISFRDYFFSLPAEEHLGSFQMSASLLKTSGSCTDCGWT